MPLPLANFSACPLPSIGAKGMTITFPGGLQIGAITQGLYATEQEGIRTLLGYVQVGLAPFKPIFDVLTALLAVKRILDAVPGVVSSPQKVVSALLDAASAFAQIAKLLPQISVPLLAGHIIDLVIRALQGFIFELDAVITKEKDIAALEAGLVGSVPHLRDAIACARAINQQRVCAIDEALAPMTPLFDTLNVFFALIGKAQLGRIEAIGHDVMGARARLGAMIGVLEGIRKTIPVPPINLKPRC